MNCGLLDFTQPSFRENGAMDQALDGAVQHAKGAGARVEAVHLRVFSLNSAAIAANAPSCRVRRPTNACDTIEYMN